MLLGLLECQPHLKLYSVGFSGSEPFSQQGYRYPSTPPVYNLPCENVNLGAACAALAGIYLTFALWSATSRSAEKARKKLLTIPIPHSLLSRLHMRTLLHSYMCLALFPWMHPWRTLKELKMSKCHWRHVNFPHHWKDYWTIPINSNMGFIVANE